MIDIKNEILKVKRPNDIIISDLNWRFLIRNVLKGKNVLMAGFTGGGKSTIVKRLSEVLNRPFFKFPLGSTQDPRATLIGNTFFSKEKGTFFKESEFVKAIQTENAIILLDEYTRAHPEAENILLTILDHQRYIKLDEEDEQRTINVAKGVCFIATANFGNEFTTTRVLDRATLDRFAIIEMPLLTEDEEKGLMLTKYPYLHDYENEISIVTQIAGRLRDDYLSDNREFSNMISTRVVEELVQTLDDGFQLRELLQLYVYPLFDKEGGADSERSKIKVLIDGILPASFISSNTVFNAPANPNNYFGKNRPKNI